MEPPIQTEYLRSGGATILTYIFFGVSRYLDVITRGTNLHTGGRQRRELLLHAIRDTRVHSRSSGQDNVAVSNIGISRNS